MTSYEIELALRRPIKSSDDYFHLPDPGGRPSSYVDIRSRQKFRFGSTGRTRITEKKEKKGRQQMASWGPGWTGGRVIEL